MADFFYWRDDTLYLNVQVHAGARRQGINGPIGDRLRISITSPPVDGKANRAVCQLLAAEFAMPQSRVEIFKGQSSNRKTVRANRPLRLPSWLYPQPDETSCH